MNNLINCKSYKKIKLILFLKDNYVKKKINNLAKPGNSRLSIPLEEIGR